MKTKIRLFPMLSLAVAALLPGVVEAQFEYFMDNGNVFITGYTDSARDVVIPSSMNGNPVVSIEELAFSQRSITSVIIPDSVTNIGNNAFENCSALASVAIPDSVWSLGNYVFYNCTSLTNVVIGTSVHTLGEGVFENCSSLPSLAINDQITSIGDYAFRICSSLTSVTIPTNIASIGVQAFYVCEGLTNVVIGDGVRSIGNLAFFGDDQLANLTLGSRVASVGDLAFYFCALTSLRIPDSVTSIGIDAFGYCSGLTNVVVGRGLSSIGAGAFSGCPALAGIYFQGAAPLITDDTTVFSGDSLVKVYHLNWPDTFDGIPTTVYGGTPTPPPASPPAVGISLYGGQPAVFFPTATGAGFVLQMTTNLASGTWTDVSAGLSISGLVVTNPPSTAFFRLH